MTKRKGDVQEPVVLYKARDFVGRIEVESATFTKTPSGWYSRDAGSPFRFRRRFPGNEPPGRATPEEALEAFHDKCGERAGYLEREISELRALQRLAISMMADLRREKGDDQ